MEHFNQVQQDKQSNIRKTSRLSTENKQIINNYYKYKQLNELFKSTSLQNKKLQSAGTQGLQRENEMPLTQENIFLEETANTLRVSARRIMSSQGPPD
jgi:hypothetical protein